MADIPDKLKELLEDFALVNDRSERAEMLIELADRFEEVPPAIADRPFPIEHKVIRCESEAYVWAEDQADGTQYYHFAVENPQGLSAKAMAVVIEETMSGAPPEQVDAVDNEVIFQLFGKDLSMGKGQGLLGMLDVVQHEVKQRLKARRRAD